MPPAPTPAPVTPVQTDPASFRTAEFNQSYNLGDIGAEYAYAEGLTGSGVTIGILDFNFDFLSTEVNYASGSVGPNQTYIDLYEAQTGETADTEPHGHAVAVFAAGAKNNIDTQGVAYDARVLAVDYFSGVNMSVQQQGGVTYHVFDPFTYMTNRGARVINISIGYDEGDLIPTPPAVTDVYTIADPLTAISAGAILVAAAGNNSDPEPMLSDLDIMDAAQAAGLLSSGAGAYIIVGSVDVNNVISDFSDRAGRARDIYLVAPGEDVVFPYEDNTGKGLFVGSGTSFSAPLVSGAAAILFQRWPQLTGRQIADILLSTATDLGDPGTDDVYGRGLLNLQAAIQPQGAVTTTIAGASATAMPIEQLGMVLGQAFGDARPYGFSHVMGLDRYGRDYYYDLDRNVINRAETGVNLEALLDQYRGLDAAAFALRGASASLYVEDNPTVQYDFGSWLHYLHRNEDQRRLAAFSVRGKALGWDWQLGTGLSMTQLLDGRRPAWDQPRTLGMQGQDFLPEAGTFAAASYDLGNGTQLAFGLDVDAIPGVPDHPNPLLRDSEDRLTSAMQLNHRFQDGVLGLRLGAIIDNNGVLGSRGAGGFDIADGSTTGFASLSGRYRLSPNISIEGRVAAGMSWVQPAREASYFNGLNHFLSTSWSLQLHGRDLGIEHSNWILGITQPLRVENARVSTRVATGIDISSGLPIFATRQFSFTPSGREIAIEAAWQYKRDQWMVQANLMNRMDAGHVKGRNEPAGMVWYRLEF